MEWDHTCYFHYTSLDTIDKILSGRCFWLANVGGFNDIWDQRQFGDEKDYYFSLCFSTGINENLPLWYLYSGIDGKGGRLRLTASKVKELIDKGSYRLVKREGDKTENVMQLVRDSTMEVQFKDIIYVKEDEDKKYCALKYNTMTNYQISKENFERYRKKHMGFQKGLIWYYEKETRLLVRLRGEAEKELSRWKESSRSSSNANTTGCPYHIELEIPDKLMKSIQISVGPGIKREEIENVLEGKEGIRSFERLTSKIQPSEYAGTIELHLKEDLCRNCEKNQGKQQ